MKKLRRLISGILALCLILTLMPVSTLAEEMFPETTVVEIIAPAEETTVHAEIETEPTVDTAMPTVAGTETVAETVEDVSREAVYDIVDSGTCGDNLTWSLDCEAVLTIAGIGAMVDFSTGTAPWHNYADEISGVIIEQGVTSIGEYAFHLCRSMQAISLPAGLTEIGYRAFWYCENLYGIEIPGTVATIGKQAFYGTGLKQVSIPEGVASVGTSTFARCENLTSVSISSSVTVIGDNAFEHCTALEKIAVDESNPNYSSVDGVLFDKSGGVLLCYPGGKSGEYFIPDGVHTIEHYAFYLAKGLTAVHIPKSVSTVYCGAFEQCSGLKAAFFEGDAPTIAYANYNNPEVFYGVSATAYYPENNSTWTAEAMESYGTGASITWKFYVPEEEPEEEENEEEICRLDELTELDYLAFSKISYFNFDEYCPSEDPDIWYTVKDSLRGMGKWEDTFNDEGIKYKELCSHIKNWRVYATENLCSHNGFYCVAFQNSHNEVVISFRGSDPLNGINDVQEMFTDPEKIDAWWDWVVHDLLMTGLNNADAGTQQFSAFEFYETVKNSEEKPHVAVTGHSLGGGLANIIAARYGCECVSYNAISALDTIYTSLPLEMGKNFKGVDKWEFVDHANEHDILAGMFEAYNSVRIKPYIAHKSLADYNSSDDNSVEDLLYYIENHGLGSYVTRDSDGNPALTEVTSRFKPDDFISNYMLFTDNSVDLGTSSWDDLNKGPSVAVNRFSFGGDGSDNIVSSIRADILVGGPGVKDILDGGWGDDTYIYYKGDGLDVIYDSGGEDTLWLYGFSDDDYISVSDQDDSDYINILCNGSIIVQICKNKREYSVLDRFTIKINEGAKQDITVAFRPWGFSYRTLFRCPVNVEILDAEGNVVYVLEDGNTGGYYTEYGNFYVFEEEDGGYGKALDLVDGYTARVVGVGEGTMKIDYREVVDGELAEPKNFADVPITTDFTATFEETDNGGLVLAADTDGDDIVDTKIGYDGKPVTPDTVTISQEYIVLKPGDSVCLEAKAQPASLTEFVQWSVEGNDETVVSVDENGTVTANGIGTSYVLATVEVDGIVATGRCRVDVAQTEVIESAEPEETVEVIKLDGIQLSTNKLTAELYSTNYAEFDILLKLPQNFAATAAATVAMPENKGVAITSAKFTDPELADLFDLVTLDDRTIAVVPNEKAVWNPDLVGKSYSSAVTVTVQGKEYTSEALTLTVKKTLPKLKATVPAFNNFWSGQTQEITITGATVTGISCENLPDWLSLNGTELSLNENVPAKGGSAKLTLLVETEEWAVPVETALSVKCSYKAPGLKLSASSIQLAGVNSDGVQLQLLSKDKKLTLNDLGVSGISAPDGYAVDYNAEDGSFVIKATENFQPGKINLEVGFHNTSETVAIPLTVKVTPVTLKLAPNSITLNSDTGDSAAVNVTATPADYRLTAPDIRILDAAKQDKTDSGELKLSYENGRLSISTTDLTPDNAKYTLYISAEGGKEAALKISTTNAEPTLKLKAAGNLDLSIPDRKIGLTTTFKNHSGGNLKAIDYTVTESIGKAILDEDSKAIQLTKEGADLFVQLKDTSGINIKNTYTLNLKLTLENGKELESSVKIPVKQTNISLKLSANKLTLNKAIGDKATVAVTCATKDYNFTAPVWTLLDSKGREVENGILDISWADEKLTVATTEATPYGASYKLQIAPEKGAKAVTLAIVIPAEDKSTVTGTLKATGNLDVIRDGTALTITPTWKNCNDAEREEILTIRNGSGEDVTAQFVIEEENGKYILTRAGALDHTQKYTATLTATFANGTTAMASGALKLKMGSAKLTLKADSTTLFANDKHSRVNISFASADSTLNKVAKVTLDPKLANQFELFDYGNGQYAIGFKDGTVPAKRTSANIALNVWLEGNETAKANASVKVKLSIVR